MGKHGLRTGQCLGKVEFPTWQHLPVEQQVLPDKEEGEEGPVVLLQVHVEVA